MTPSYKKNSLEDQCEALGKRNNIFNGHNGQFRMLCMYKNIFSTVRETHIHPLVQNKSKVFMTYTNGFRSIVFGSC